MPYVISLAMTLLIEGAFALIWGLRGRDLALLALMNVATNPLVVLLYRLLLPLGVAAVLLPEAGAVAFEMLCCCKLQNRIRRPALFALCVNLFSYTAGVLLQTL